MCFCFRQLVAKNIYSLVWDAAWDGLVTGLLVCFNEQMKELQTQHNLCT